MVKRYSTLLKPGTLLNNARSPPNRRLFGLVVVILLFCCCCLLMACALRAQEVFAPAMDVVIGVIRCGIPPPLELEAEELPDVVDSASTLLAASTTGLVLTRLESNCERKPRLEIRQQNRGNDKSYWNAVIVEDIKLFLAHYLLSNTIK